MAISITTQPTGAVTISTSNLAGPEYLEYTLGFNYAGPLYSFTDADGLGNTNRIMPPATGGAPISNPLTWQINATAAAGTVQVTCPQDAAYTRQVQVGYEVDFWLGVCYLTTTKYDLTITKKDPAGAARVVYQATCTGQQADPHELLGLTVKFS